jgi:hypothetical protein
VKKAEGKMGESPHYQFCALEYRPQSWNIASAHIAPVILLVLMDEEEHLRLLVAQDWRKIVQAEDTDYIESLLQDFVERAKLHPADLYKQLLSLGVGPLVTRETGSDLSDYTSFQELSLDL